jgi:SagB-type dehydrogenase family enzyme
MNIKTNSFRKIISDLDKSILNPQKIANLSALLYQENSKLCKFSLMKLGESVGSFSNPYMLQRACQPYKCFPTHKIISMKEYESAIPADANFFDVVKRRRSIRDYENYNISLNELYHLLHYCYGITEQQPVRGAEGVWSYRSVPSGGGLYPLEIYLYLNNSVLPKGIYHYRPDLNALEVVCEKDLLPELKEYIVAEPYINISDCSCIVLISSVVKRMLLKYGERGYRFILQEVGYVSQNISLTCTAINLASCMVGGFADNKINEIIKADGTFETIQGVIIIGKEKNII